MKTITLTDEQAKNLVCLVEEYDTGAHGATLRPDQIEPLARSLHQQLESPPPATRLSHRCSVCGASVTVSGDGLADAHHHPVTGLCKGSGQAPAKARP